MRRLTARFDAALKLFAEPQTQRMAFPAQAGMNLKLADDFPLFASMDGAAVIQAR